jgi:hypothetical protein
MKKYKASCPTPWGKHIKASGESRIMAVVALHRVARLTNNHIDFTNLVVKTK